MGAGLELPGGLLVHLSLRIHWPLAFALSKRQDQSAEVKHVRVRELLRSVAADEEALSVAVLQGIGE